MCCRSRHRHAGTGEQTRQHSRANSLSCWSTGPQPTNQTSCTHSYTLGQFAVSQWALLPRCLSFIFCYCGLQTVQATPAASHTSQLQLHNLQQHTNRSAQLHTHPKQPSETLYLPPSRTTQAAQPYPAGQVPLLLPPLLPLLAPACSKWRPGSLIAPPGSGIAMMPAGLGEGLGETAGKEEADAVADAAGVLLLLPFAEVGFSVASAAARARMRAISGSGLHSRHVKPSAASHTLHSATSVAPGPLVVNPTLHF